MGIVHTSTKMKMNTSAPCRAFMQGKSKEEVKFGCVISSDSHYNKIWELEHEFIKLGRRKKGDKKPETQSDQGYSEGEGIVLDGYNGIGWDFMKLTGDPNPIHWSDFFAKSVGFRGGKIVHGLWSIAAAAAKIENKYKKSVVEISCDFKKPFYQGKKGKLYDDGAKFSVQVDDPRNPGQFVPHLIGQFTWGCILILLFFICF